MNDLAKLGGQGIPQDNQLPSIESKNVKSSEGI
jgi:hypothetical protein